MQNVNSGVTTIKCVCTFHSGYDVMYCTVSVTCSGQGVMYCAGQCHLFWIRSYVLDSKWSLVLSPQAFPLAIASVRSVHSHCPREVLQFLSDLIKYNDNRLNKVSAPWSRDNFIHLYIFPFKK